MEKIFETHDYHGDKCIFKITIKELNVNSGEGEGCVMLSYNPFNADQIKNYRFVIIKKSMSHWRVALSYFGVDGIVVPDLKIHDDYIIVNNKKIQNGDQILFDGKGGLFKIDKDLIPNLEKDKICQNYQVIKQYQKTINEQGIKIGVITTKKEKIKESLAYGTRLNTLYRVEDIFYGKPQENLKSYLLNKDLKSLSEIKKNLFQNLTSYFANIPLKFRTFIRLIDIPIKDWPSEDIKKLKVLYGNKIFNDRDEPISGGPLMMCQKELYQTQVNAIVEAMIQSKDAPKISIGLPNTTEIEQIKLLKKMIEVSKNRYKTNLKIDLYTHDETLALDLNKIKKISPLLSAVSIGASDLTADVTGISRNDLLKINEYREKNNIDYDIYKQLLPDVEDAIRKRVQVWRSSNPNIKLICCSSHLAESLKFFHDMKFDFVGGSSTGIPKILENLYKLIVKSKKKRLINKKSSGFYL